MATKGFIPSHANPAAKVTACCSAIATSKVRSGYCSPKMLTPVPDGIAAVIATIVLSIFAWWVKLVANTSV